MNTSNSRSMAGQKNDRPRFQKAFTVLCLVGLLGLTMPVLAHDPPNQCYQMVLLEGDVIWLKPDPNISEDARDDGFGVDVPCPPSEAEIHETWMNQMNFYAEYGGECWDDGHGTYTNWHTPRGYGFEYRHRHGCHIDCKASNLLGVRDVRFYFHRRQTVQIPRDTPGQTYTCPAPKQAGPQM